MTTTEQAPTAVSPSVQPGGETPHLAPDALTLSRPAGITDGRWSALRALAEKVVTGHTPWCTDHHAPEPGEGGQGWCRYSDTFWCGQIELNTGTTDGSTAVSLYLATDVRMEELTIAQAAVLGDMLTLAANAARNANAIPAGVAQGRA